MRSEMEITPHRAPQNSIYRDYAVLVDACDELGLPHGVQRGEMLRRRSELRPAVFSVRGPGVDVAERHPVLHVIPAENALGGSAAPPAVAVLALRAVPRDFEPVIEVDEVLLPVRPDARVGGQPRLLPEQRVQPEERREALLSRGLPLPHAPRGSELIRLRSSDDERSAVTVCRLEVECAPF